MPPRPTRGNWKIFVDISGDPITQDTYIGMFLFNYNYKPRFLTDFYGAFPQLRHYSKKSTKAKADTLKQVIEFFDRRKLRMACVKFTVDQWTRHKLRLNQLHEEIVDPNFKYRHNFGGYKEKILGVLYYYGITHLGIQSDNYDVVTCAETRLDIWQVINTVHKLAHRDKWNISVTPNLRTNEEMLKMADYVAGANNRLPEVDLKGIGRHLAINTDVKDYDLVKAFKIYPAEPKSVQRKL